ncbi:MAG: ribonuclease III, partial [Alphaproteobacteria bacterium]|nr:ribonuclease III [Alphaproteobacteria bacterium]
GAPADAKTVLQEWAQAKGLPPPDYQNMSRTGPDHAPEFTIEVRLDGFAPLSAIGASKKVAEQRAAEALLLREEVWQR